MKSWRLPGRALRMLSSRWAAVDKRPLLLIDEIDTLVGDALLSVLRQLRSGYDQRLRGFPQSVILCGVRCALCATTASDRARSTPSSSAAARSTSRPSPWPGRLQPCRGRDPASQRAGDIGQAFTEQARDAIWKLTRGQPWRVNALAYEVCFESKAGRAAAAPASWKRFTLSGRCFIARRETHSHLADTLREACVWFVIEPLPAGADDADSAPADDLQYLRDLGLVGGDGRWGSRTRSIER